jgi:hypothetical protein
VIASNILPTKKLDLLNLFRPVQELLLASRVPVSEETASVK